MPDLPHFDAPFRLDNTGKPVVVEQDSQQDIGACVYNVVVCTQGDKLNDPTFGIPPVLFSPVPVDMAGIVDAISALEPRAEMSGVQTVGQLREALVTVTTGLFASSGLFPGAGVLPGGVSEQQIDVIGGPGDVTIDLTATVEGS